MAERLALWALSDYGIEGLPTLGPVFDRAEREGSRMRVYYKNADDRLSLDGAIRGFEICGADRVFHAAEAAREGFDSSTIVVWSDQVAEPVAVRYCFRNFLQGNVRSRYGLPALPFRSDDF